jgi:hypothetical protein
VAYRLRLAEAEPESLAAWESHTERLGPFKRPRNAMVEGERQVTFLRRRHGDAIAFGPGT